MKNLFIELNNIAKDTKLNASDLRSHLHELTMEATHHGPFVDKPAVFVEIGSTEKEWNDKNNGKIIAETIMSGLNDENENYKIAVGIGGGHYCNNFNKLVLRTDIADYTFEKSDMVSTMPEVDENGALKVRAVFTEDSPSH